MKTIIIILLLLSNAVWGQTKKGDIVPHIYFETILNAPVGNIDLSQLRGKIVLIDFWATWCGSCLQSMPHLKQLQDKYPDKLQIITVTAETERRTAQYLAVKPSNLWFAVDTGGSISRLFPHQVIPHTVLISPDGILIANTNPESVTAQVIDSLLSGQTVTLPEKEDNRLNHEDLISSTFFAADTVRSRFMMQPEIKGASGMSTTYLNDSIFNGRRISCINVSLARLYMIAFGNFPYSRVIDHTPKNNEAAYCVDLIVENKEDLLPTLIRELLKRFDLQAKTEMQSKEVYVLKVQDMIKFKTIPRNKSGVRTYYSRHGQIDQQAVSMEDFAAYLESYGTGRLPVIDETHLKDKFDIKFSFQPENPASLTEILTGMGLRLEREVQEIEMLVLYKELKL